MLFVYCFVGGCKCETVVFQCYVLVRAGIKWNIVGLFERKERKITKIPNFSSSLHKHSMLQVRAELKLIISLPTRCWLLRYATEGGDIAVVFCASRLCWQLVCRALVLWRLLQWSCIDKKCVYMLTSAVQHLWVAACFLCIHIYIYVCFILGPPLGFECHFSLSPWQRAIMETHLGLHYKSFWMLPAWRKAMKTLDFTSPWSLSHACLHQKNRRLLQTSQPGMSWLPLAPPRCPWSGAAVTWAQEERAVGGTCARRSRLEESATEQEQAGGSFPFLQELLRKEGKTNDSLMV